MSARLLLGVDTSTEYLALALVAAGAEPNSPGGALVAESLDEVGREHSARLLPALSELLKRAGAVRSDIAGVGVGVGPGSYTGVRIGIATAKALGASLGVPVGGSPSPLARMTPAVEEGERAVAITDARRGNVYALLAERLPFPHPLFEPLEEPIKLPRSELAERFPGLPLLEGPPGAAVLARRALLNGSLGAHYL